MNCSHNNSPPRVSNTTVESHCIGVGCSKSLCPLKQSSKSVDICRYGHPAGICLLFKTLLLQWCPSRPEAILDQLVAHMRCRHPGIMASGCLLAAGGAGKLASRPLCKHPKSDQSLVGIHAACSTRPYTVHEVMLSAASRCIKTISGKLWQTLWTKNKEG